MMNIIKPIVVLAGAYALAVPMTQAATLSIENSGFESGWSDWSKSGSAAISGDSYSDSKSAKTTGSSGFFEQAVTVSADTNYTLSAWILGSGSIGATVGSTDQSVDIDSSSWEQASVTFNSGSNTSITIFGKYSGDEGRFDEFSLVSSDADVEEETDTSAETDTDVEEASTEVDTETCTDSYSLSISTATDDGTHEDGYGPLLSIDDSFEDGSYWSSTGAPKSIVYDLGEESEVTELEIAFYKGDERSSYFYVETSTDGDIWTSVLEDAVSSGTTTDLELFDLIDSDARYVRITGNGNNADSSNTILETNILGCGEVDSETSLTYDELDASLPPSGNFELEDWYLSIPTDDDGNGKADSIKEYKLIAGYTHDDYFYTADDGGMVFKVTVKGYKTSNDTTFTRTELREMLRRGDTSIDTEGVNENNWVFSSAPSDAQDAAGGVDGVLTATLAVNHVTTTGDSDEVGRVVIGQIHANDDEPVRIYYRQLPGHTKGSIYMAHEPNGGSDSWYELIGSRDDDASEPEDGVALDEKFGYEIKVVGNDMWVAIMRDGKEDVVQYIDMSNSSYDVADQFMYFKAGVYIQDKTGDSDDYAQATFYKLENSHDGYDY